MTVTEVLQSAQFLTIDGEPMVALHADLWAQLIEQLESQAFPSSEIPSASVMRQEDQERLQNYRETGYAISHDRVAEWLDSIGTENELPCPTISLKH